MIRNYWITKDYFDKHVNVNFVEPTLAKFNVFLHMLSEEKRIELANRFEKGKDFVIKEETYSLVVEGNRTELFLAGDQVPEYIYTDLLAEVLNAYHLEMLKMNNE